MANFASTGKRHSERETGATMQTKYLSPNEAAEYYGLSTSAMENMRVSYKGTPFYRFGCKVHYVLAEHDQWVAARQTTLTILQS